MTSNMRFYRLGFSRFYVRDVEWHRSPPEAKSDARRRARIHPTVEDHSASPCRPPSRDPGLREARQSTVIRLQRNRKRMAVLTAMREGKARRIRESRRCAINRLRDERHRLERARA